MAIPRVTGPSVELKPLTVPFQEISTSSSQFGGLLAQAAGDLSRGIGSLAQQADAIAADMKLEDDKRAVKDADNQFSAFLRSVEFGETDEKGNVTRRGFYDMKGGEAVSGAPATKMEVQDKLKELMGTMANQSQKDAFSNAAYARLNTAFENIDKYTLDQRRVAADMTDDARINEAKDNFAAHPFDRRVRGQSLIIATEATTSKAKRNGWSPEVTISKMQEAQSAVLKKGIEAAIQQNPTGAQALYEEAKGSIDGTLRPEIETLLKDAVVRQKGQQEADAIMSRPDWSDIKRLKVARDIKDPLVRDDVVRRVKNRIAENEAFRSKRVKEVEDALYQRVWSGEGLDNIFANSPDLAREAMKDYSLMVNLRNAEDILANGQNFGRVTDPAVQAKLELMDPAELANINPLKYKGSLTKTDYGTLLDLIRGARASEAAKAAKDPKDHQVYQRAENALKDFAPVALKWGKADQGNDLNRMQHRIQYEMNTWVSDQLLTRKDIPVPELEKKAAELTTKITGGWFSGVPNVPAAQISDLTPEQRAKAYVEPETAPRHLLQNLEARGVPMDEDTKGRVLFAILAGDKALEAKALGLTPEEYSNRMLDASRIPGDWKAGFESYLSNQGVTATDELIRALAYTQVMGDTSGQLDLIRRAKRAQ